MYNSINVFDTKTRKKLQRIEYDSATDEVKKMLKEQQERGEITLFCSCSEKLEMKVTNNPSKRYFYPAKKGEDYHHANTCVRNPKYIPNSEYEKAWSRDIETGILKVTIGKITPEKADESESKETKNRKIENTAPMTYEDFFTTNENAKPLIYQESTIRRQGKATIFGLITKINMMAWQRMAVNRVNSIIDKEQEGKISEKLGKMVWKISEEIYINRNKNSLQSMFYKGNNKSIVPKKEVFFVYGYYKGTVIKQYGTIRKHIAVIQDRFGKEHGFYINDIVEFNVMLNREKSHSKSVFIGGFVYKENKTYHYLSLINYNIFAVCKMGLYVESSYEKQVFEVLFDNRDVFYKPFNPIEGYEDFIPDFLLINREKLVVGEIFGVRGNLEYENRKERKIALSNKVEFKNEYDFWSWDATKDEEFKLI